MTAASSSPPAMLTFDLEDWYQLMGRQFRFVPDQSQTARLGAQIDRILELLHRYETEATFFVLGMTARAHPEVVERVARAGHEIACHGHSHQPVRAMSEEEFARDIDESIEAIGTATGQVPRGYRAPAFSIDRDTFWAYDVLIDRGFAYDSSVFPFRGRRYGIPEFSTDVTTVSAPSGRALVELPLATLEVRRARLPVAGGGYWRLLPEATLTRAVVRIASQRAPMLYFHPAEFDDLPLRPPMTAPRAWPFALVQDLGRRRVPRKLARLLERVRATSIRSYLQL